jgi:predicted DNA-binding transcriptional regulator YafY
MAKEKNQKAKLLYLLDILRNESHETCSLTTKQLISKLNERGIPVDRKTLYEDIKFLNSIGYEIFKERKKSNKYWIAERPFDLAELRILMDAVQSAKFITECKTKQLIDKIADLAGTKLGEELKKNMSSINTVKHTNERIFYNTDTIHNCLQAGKKVSFKYFDYGLDGSKIFRKEGERYVVNPIELLLSEENYYLICCTDKYRNIISFRVDRMLDVEMEDDPIAEHECISSFDLNEYKKEVFHMYGGEQQSVTLLADNSMVNMVLDKFGEDIELTKVDDNKFSVTVNVRLSPTFFSWCFLFGDKLRVTAPEDVVALLKSRLEELKVCYA